MTTTLSPRVEAFRIRAKAHAVKAAPLAIGCKQAVRIDKSTVVRGVIVACTPRERFDGTWGWTIEMECGSDKVRRSFDMKQIPQG